MIACHMIYMIERENIIYRKKKTDKPYIRAGCRNDVIVTKPAKLNWGNIVCRDCRTTAGRKLGTALESV